MLLFCFNFLCFYTHACIVYICIIHIYARMLTLCVYGLNTFMQLINRYTVKPYNALQLIFTRNKYFSYVENKIIEYFFLIYYSTINSEYLSEKKF